MSDRASHSRVDGLVDRSGTEVALDEPGRRATGHSLEIRDPERIAARRGAPGRAGDGSRSRARTRSGRDRACAASRWRMPARRPRAGRRLRGGRGLEAALFRSEPTRSARSGGRVGAWWCAAARHPGRRAHTPPPRTGSAHAAIRRRSPPPGRGRAGSAAGCKRCRTGSGLGWRYRDAVAEHRAHRRGPVESRRRETARSEFSAAAPPARARRRRPPRSCACGPASGRGRRLGPVRGRRRSAPSPGRAPRGRRRRGSRHRRRAAVPAHRRPRSRPQQRGGLASPARSRAVRRGRERCEPSPARRHAPPRAARLPARPGRRSVADDRSSASSSPRPSGRREGRRVRAGVPRESRRRAEKPRVRRAEEGVEVAARTVAPREPEQREQRLAERCGPEPRLRLDRQRYAERAESGLDRRARPLERGADDRNLLRRRSLPDEMEEVSATSSSVARRPAPSRKRTEPSRGAGLDVVVEEAPLEMSEPGRQIRGGPGERARRCAVGELPEIVRGL